MDAKSLPSTRWSGSLVLSLLFASLAATASGESDRYYFSTLTGESSIGSADGPGDTARFNEPTDVALDAEGNLYVADYGNHTIRKITPAGIVSTFAGMAGSAGRQDGAGSEARFFYPSNLAFDASGNLFVSDQQNECIRRITPNGMVTTWVGKPGYGGAMDGAGETARFISPAGIAIDSTGTLYVADRGNGCVRKVTPAGVVSTLAGPLRDPSLREFGHVDGTGDAARFRSPFGLAADRLGYLYVTDSGLVRRIAPDGTVATLGGASGAAWTGSYFQYPTDIAFDAAGTAYISDNNHTLRKITSQGVDTTWAGRSLSAGSTDGPGDIAQFRFPTGVAVDAKGNVFLADQGNNTVRKIAPDGIVSTVAGIGLEASMGASDGPRSTARFRELSGIAVGPAGEIYVADPLNGVIRRVDPDGKVSTTSGGFEALALYAKDLEAELQFSVALAVDRSGNLYVADSYHRRIQKITPAGVATTLFQGPTPECRLAAIAVDGSGNVYFTDNRRYSEPYVRKVSPDGTVSILAGPSMFTAGEKSGSWDRSLTSLCVDAVGNVYVGSTSDGGGSIRNRLPRPWLGTIRKISPAGVVTPIAGGSASSDNFSDGPVTTAGFAVPVGMAIDATGRLFFVDHGYATVRVINPDGSVQTLGGAAGSYGITDGFAHAARFLNPSGLALDSSGALIVPDGSVLRQGRLARAPSIATEPQNLTVNRGGNVQLSVTASGVPEPTYQWFRDGAPFTGATSSTLAFTNARDSDAGVYTVTVTNALGTVTSARATLTVNSVATPSQPSPSAGGGGSPSFWFIGALLALGVFRGRLTS